MVRYACAYALVQPRASACAEFPLCLFATAHCPYAHQIRMLLEVKGALAAVPIVELSAEQLQDPGLGVLTKSGRRALPVLWTGKRVLPAQNCLDTLDHLDAMFAEVPLWPSEPDVRAHARSMIDYGIRVRLRPAWAGARASHVR